MSLCFALNLIDGVLIAADGRLSKKFKDRNENSGFDFFPKLQPLTNNSLMFIGGLSEPCEMIRHEVKSNLTKGSLQEIINLIQCNSLKYEEKYKDLLHGDNDAVSGTVLAFYDEKPCIISFSNVDGYKPTMISEIGNYGFRGIGQDIAIKCFESKIEVGKHILDAIYETYKEVNKVFSEVGGIFSGYLLNNEGIKLVAERMI